MSEPIPDPNGITSVETADGRVLSGVGVTEASLQDTIEAREPVEKAPDSGATSPATPEAPSAPRDTETGRFKPSRADKRIGQLTAQKSDAERALEAEKTARADLERRLAALEASRTVPAAQTPPPSPVPAPAAQPTRQKPSESEVGVKYETYADFAEDLADWKVEQRLQAMNFDALVRSGIEADRASRAQIEYVQSFGTRARSVYPDFDAVIAQADPTIQFPDLKVLLNAPNAEHLVYHAAKNPDFARKLASERDPIKIGYLMASVSGPAVAPPAPTAAPVASAAPAPYQPVGSGSKTSTPTLDELAASGDDYDKSGYRERRAAERKGGRR